MITKQFVTGGNATFTVVSKTGEYLTFKVRKPKDDCPYFVSLMTGPDNESSFSYLGILKEDTGDVVLTKKSRYTDDTKAVKVIRWAMRMIWNNGNLPDGYQIKHAGKCGCCGRKLTTPESLTIGLGPECVKKFGIC